MVRTALLEKRLGVQGRVGHPARAAGRDPVTSEALDPGHGEFRDIPHLSCQKDGQNIEESWENGREKIPFKEQREEGAVRGRKRRQRRRAGDRKTPDWNQL